MEKRLTDLSTSSSLRGNSVREIHQHRELENRWNRSARLYCHQRKEEIVPAGTVNKAETYLKRGLLDRMCEPRPKNACKAQESEVTFVIKPDLLFRHSEPSSISQKKQ